MIGTFDEGFRGASAPDLVRTVARISPLAPWRDIQNLWGRLADRELSFRNFGESTVGSSFAGRRSCHHRVDKRSYEPTKRHPSAQPRAARKGGSRDLLRKTPSSTQPSPIAAQAVYESCRSMLGP